MLLDLLNSSIKLTVFLTEIIFSVNIVKSRAKIFFRSKNVSPHENSLLILLIKSPLQYNLQSAVQVLNSDEPVMNWNLQSDPF